MITIDDKYILKLIEKAVKGEYTQQKFNFELNKYLSELSLSAAKKSLILEQANELINYINKLYYKAADEKDIETVINYYKWKTLYINENIQRRLIKIFNKHLQSLNYDELKDEVTKVLNLQKHYQNTIVNTTIAGLDNIKNINNKVNEYIKHNRNLPKFKFAGAPPERPFCKLHYNKIYTIEQIKTLNNGQGLPVISHLGGYNCRHFWQLVTE